MNTDARKLAGVLPLVILNRSRHDGGHMAAAQLASAALRIPCKDLLQAAPAILTAAGELVARLSDRRRRPVSQGKSSRDVAAMVTRLEALEMSGVSQAELTEEMAKQLKEVTKALRIVAFRMLFALGVALVAFVLGLAALIRTFP
jgi:hypothetical protein